MRLQELKFQAVLRLEVMAALVSHDDAERVEALSNEARHCLSRLSMSAEGSSQLRPFFNQVLVAK
jgi:hypothetical protein